MWKFWKWKIWVSEQELENTITNRIQKMEERISGTEDMIEEIDSSVKENAKSKTLLKQNIQEIGNIMKRPNLR